MSAEPSFSRAAVLGTGAWGTTFAQLLATAHLQVRMWGRNESLCEFINSGENPTYLPGIELSERIVASPSLPDTLHDAELIVIAVPVRAIRSTLHACRDLIAQDAVFVSLSKGLELDTRMRVDEIIAEAANVDPSRIAVVSGPNLSREIAEHNPTATVVASRNLELAIAIAKTCRSDFFRPYVSTDVVGCEIAGATKNVIAVAIGAAEGMGLGFNTRATLMTRGLAEMTRLGTALGADPETFAGLAGIGDLTATCSSRLSRNFSFGHRLGTGLSVPEAFSLSAGIVEGAHSAEPILRVAQDLGVDMPITAAVVAVIRGEATIEEMGRLLLDRPQKRDGWRIDLL